MKKQRRQYTRPKIPYDKERIESEKKLLERFGLRRKKEIWRADFIVREYRRIARRLAAEKEKESESILLEKLIRLGLLSKGAELDDVLVLNTENLLDRRLQTIVQKKGLANTLKQARQFIVHGHIAINGRRTRWPSAIIPVSDEKTVSFYETSKVKKTKLKKLKKPKKKEVKKEEKPKEKSKKEPKKEEKPKEEKKSE